MITPACRERSLRVASTDAWGRRHGEMDVADPSWLPTKEHFIDPITQRVMRVWVDPADHARHSVPD